MKKNSRNNIILLLIIFGMGLALMYFGRQNDTPRAQDFSSFIGREAPAFALSDREGNVYSLDKLKGKNVLLFFNEGLSCYPACWDEMVALSKDKRFEENNTEVLSVVTDTKEQWQKAKEKMTEFAGVKVIFDADAAASKAYGMLTAASSMHRGTAPGHAYVLIDKNGIIRYIFDDIRMGKNADKLLQEIKKLN